MYLYIDSYNWEAYLFIEVNIKDKYSIIKKLYNLGFDEDIIINSVKNLEYINNGFCYSDFNMQRSIIIINETSSLGEFLNSFIHEINHLCSHIEEKFKINPYSEEASYLIGNVAQSIFNNYAHTEMY